MWFLDCVCGVKVISLGESGESVLLLFLLWPAVFLLFQSLQSLIVWA